MVKCLNTFITSYIHHDQSGFMPTRQLADTVRKSLNIINYYTAKRITTIIMVLDAEKAFDRLEAKYLIQLLQFKNFGPIFLRTIGAFYSKPEAQLVINNLRSDDFALTRGKRQGCPLSPLLFAVSMEPMGETICQNHNIKGVTIGHTRHVISLFTNDTVIYVTDPLASLQHLLLLIKGFGEVSGFAINQTKTELFPICLSGPQSTKIQSRYNFKWVTTT